MLCSGAEVHRVEGRWGNRRHNLWNVGLCGDAVTGCFNMCLWYSCYFNHRDYPFHLLWLLTENSGTYYDITVCGNAKSICTMYPPLEEKNQPWPNCSLKLLAYVQTFFQRFGESSFYKALLCFWIIVLKNHRPACLRCFPSSTHLTWISGWLRDFCSTWWHAKKGMKSFESGIVEQRLI